MPHPVLYAIYCMLQYTIYCMPATIYRLPQRWVPRYGAKKAQAEREKNWVMEVPTSIDPNTDMFAKVGHGSEITGQRSQW